MPNVKKEDLRVSIVLPTYNGARWVRETINSVLEQTYENWELIIVDDCSTDCTSVILSYYTDKRIKVLRNKRNLKLPNSLNVGFSIAKGDYLTWISDDNAFKKDALEKMVYYLEKNKDIDFVSMNHDVIDEKGFVISDYDSNFEYKRTPAYLLIGSNVGGAFMYRASVRKVVGDYDSKYFCGEDYDYWCRVALVFKIAYVNENVFKYRLQSNSLSATNKRLMRKNTKEIQSKYCFDFFIKYNYTEQDKIKFWSKLGISRTPGHYVFYVCLFSFLKACTKGVVKLSDLLNVKAIKKVKSIFINQGKFSFSEQK